MRKYIPVTVAQTIWEELELPNEDTKLRELVAEGLPVKVLYMAVSLMGLNQTRMLEALRIPPSTFLRRKRAGRFAIEESDRLYCNPPEKSEQL